MFVHKHAKNVRDDASCLLRMELSWDRPKKSDSLFFLFRKMELVELHVHGQGDHSTSSVQGLETTDPSKFSNPSHLTTHCSALSSPRCIFHPVRAFALMDWNRQEKIFSASTLPQLLATPTPILNPHLMMRECHRGGQILETVGRWALYPFTRHTRTFPFPSFTPHHHHHHRTHFQSSAVS